jgi:hypothetical protein
LIEGNTFLSNIHPIVYRRNRKATSALPQLCSGHVITLINALIYAIVRLLVQIIG